MEEKIYLGILYEEYKNLFTQKQRNYFEDYYYNDLSLSEIAENENVSRNAVHSQIKIVEERLIELEKELKLYEKKQEILKMLSSKLSEEEYKKIEELL